MTAPNLLDSLFGPNDQAFKGLLDIEGQQAARRRSLMDAGISMLEASQNGGFGGALAAGLRGGREGYNSVLGERMAGQELQQKQQMTAKRADIARRYAAKPNETPEQIDDRLRGMLGEFVNAGMMEEAGRLSEYLKARGSASSKEKEPGTWVTVPGPDGKPMRRYVTASEAGQGIPEYEPPRRDTDSAMTINSRFQNEERLVNNYERRVADVQTTADAYVSARIGHATGGAAGDAQILYSFIRALDPASVVREGEVALVQAAMPLLGRAQVMQARVAAGGMLDEATRNQMMELMKQMTELKARRAEESRADAQDRARRFGLDVHLRDPLERYRQYTRTQPGGGNAANVRNALGGGR